MNKSENNISLTYLLMEIFNITREAKVNALRMSVNQNVKLESDVGII